MGWPLCPAWTCSWPSSPSTPPFYLKKKDSPSRQRRRARRAAARLVNVAEEASIEETVEETVNTDPAKKPVEQSENKKTTEEVNENSTELEAEQAENPKNESENLILNDEFCSDNDFMETNINTLVDELLVKPGDNEKDAKDIMYLIDYNLKIVGIDVIKIEKEIIQSNQVFKVKIQPNRLEVLKSESFPLRNWSWRPHR